MLFLTDDLLDTLDQFFKDDVMDGALSFNFTDLRNGRIVQARFTEPPQYSRHETMWDVSVSLEILP
jgi:hypothetical protein